MVLKEVAGCTVFIFQSYLWWVWWSWKKLLAVLYSVLVYQLYCVYWYEMFLTQFALNLDDSPSTASVVDLAGSGRHLKMYL